MNNITQIALIILSMICGIYITKHELDKSQENFYYNISRKVDGLIENVREIVNGRDTQKLIAIMFRSFEEFILYTLNHKFVSKTKLTKIDWYRYNNLFYGCIASIYFEWQISGIDQRLIDLFMKKYRPFVKSHMDTVYWILMDRKLSVRERRNKLAAEQLKMLQLTADHYIAAFMEYRLIEDSKATPEQIEALVKFTGITEEELVQLLKDLKDKTSAQCIKKGTSLCKDCPLKKLDICNL